MSKKLCHCHLILISFVYFSRPNEIFPNSGISFDQNWLRIKGLLMNSNTVKEDIWIPKMDFITNENVLS